ncbi:MAG: hypothetical protein JW973_14025 [Bacteroidales bacterium]|nr:hypothetical protein [Bacteroidales bacterium]
MTRKSINPKKTLLQSIYAIICVIVFLSMAFSLHAQPGGKKTSAFYPGIGIGAGFFNPSDVNKYIENHLPAYIMEQVGFSEMILYEEVQGFLTYRIKFVDITSLVEYAIGPKLFIVIPGDDQYYFFHRLSPGLLANFYIPVGSGKHAIYIGGGAQYHFMWFEEFKGNTIGFRLQAGFSLQFGRFNIQPHLAFNLAKAVHKDESTDRTFDLNYTGGNLGINVSIHSPVANR